VPGDAEAGWSDLRAALEADLRRVRDRLGGLSAAQLAAPLPPSESGGPLSGSRAQAVREVARHMADAAWAMEHAGSRVAGPALPELADFATPDQVAVTGHDLLAAMDLAAPDDLVFPDQADGGSARQAAQRAASSLADLRRRV
jgi:hypothetical protein